MIATVETETTNKARRLTVAVPDVRVFQRGHEERYELVGAPLDDREVFRCGYPIGAGVFLGTQPIAGATSRAIVSSMAVL